MSHCRTYSLVENRALKLDLPKKGLGEVEHNLYGRPQVWCHVPLTTWHLRSDLFADETQLLVLKVLASCCQFVGQMRGPWIIDEMAVGQYGRWDRHTTFWHWTVGITGSVLYNRQHKETEVPRPRFAVYAFIKCREVYRYLVLL